MDSDFNLKQPGILRGDNPNSGDRMVDDDLLGDRLLVIASLAMTKRILDYPLGFNIPI